MVDVVLALIPGLILGIIFGFILQRGRFCMNSAIRDIVLLKDLKLIKTVMLAIFVSMIGFGVILLAGAIPYSPKHLAWGANIVGGIIFGIGMVLAAGCASGTTYRVGEGMVGSFVALLGYGTFAYYTKAGFLKDFSTNLINSTKITDGDGNALSLFGDLTPLFILILGIIGSAVFIYLWVLPEIKEARKDTESKKIDLKELLLKKPWSWSLTGIAMGVLAWFAYLSSAASGRNYPLGITGGWIGWVKFFSTGDSAALSWESWLVAGIIVGAMIAAKIAGELKLRVPKDPKTLLVQYTGGALMGIGAVTAMGCNIGNFLSGVALLSVGSILASVSIMVGCWGAVYLMFMRD